MYAKAQDFSFLVMYIISQSFPLLLAIPLLTHCTWNTSKPRGIPFQFKSLRDIEPNKSKILLGLEKNF